MNEEWKVVAALAAAMFWCVVACVKILALWGRPFRRLVTSFHRSSVESLVVVVLVVVVVHRGATKVTNGLDRVSSAVKSVERQGALCSSSRIRSGDGIPSEHISFTVFAVDTNAVHFAASLPLGLDLPNRKLDLFATHDVDTNFWELVWSCDVAFAETNLLASVPLSTFPFPCLDRLFLVLGTRSDLDGDGLIDARERLMYGTSPCFADTDADGLIDGCEMTLFPPLDPLLADTDGDGYIDGEEVNAGTDPLSPDGGAAATIRYCYDEDDRLTIVCVGHAQCSSVSVLSRSGNPVRQSASGISHETN